MAAQFACGVVWVLIGDDYADEVVWASARYRACRLSLLHTYLTKRTD